MAQQRSPGESARAVASAAAALSEALDLEARLAPFAELRWSGKGPQAPVLRLDDFSGIPFLVDITGVEEYQHRARLRADPDDLYAAVTPGAPGYELYCQEKLNLAPVDFVQATPVETRLDLAMACREGTARDRIQQRIEVDGGLTIDPFMGIEEVWKLADVLTRSMRAPVCVMAPPPPVTWIANDKQLFSQLVESVLGSEWLVETRIGRSPEVLARELLSLAERHAQVGLKRLRCASAMGNKVFAASEIRSQQVEGVTARVRRFLDRTEWQGDENVQVVAWENVDHSPSTQLWIPPPELGPPRFDGVFEQLLEGQRKVFVGSRPSTLPQAVNDAAAEGSLAVALALQTLGYVGRCSFDFVLVGDLDRDFQLHFTECNGRWGGTSIPMTFMDRLMAGRPRPPYRSQDFIHTELVGANFSDLIEQVGSEAYDVQSGTGRFIFYNTGPLETHGKLDVIAMGETQQQAEAALEEDLPRILGLS
ncbi:MAG: hypothetical protein GWP16_04050 [Nitrospirae bacterium]|nr:hypothetical protein [Nitrospirota bacterium]